MPSPVRHPIEMPVGPGLGAQSPEHMPPAALARYIDEEGRRRAMQRMGLYAPADYRAAHGPRGRAIRPPKPSTPGKATAESPGMKQEGAQFREWLQKYGGSPSLPPSDTPSATPTTAGAIASAAQGASRLAAKGGFSKESARSKGPAANLKKPAAARYRAASAGDKYEMLFTGMYSESVRQANANKKSGQAPWVPLRDYKNNKIFLVMADGNALVFDVTSGTDISRYRTALLDSGYNPNATAMVAEEASKPLLLAFIGDKTAQELSGTFDSIDFSSLVQGAA